MVKGVVSRMIKYLSNSHEYYTMCQSVWSVKGEDSYLNDLSDHAKPFGTIIIWLPCW